MRQFKPMVGLSQMHPIRTYFQTVTNLNLTAMASRYVALTARLLPCQSKTYSQFLLSSSVSFFCLQNFVFWQARSLAFSPTKAGFIPIYRKPSPNLSHLFFIHYGELSRAFADFKSFIFNTLRRTEYIPDATFTY